MKKLIARLCIECIQSLRVMDSLPDELLLHILNFLRFEHVVSAARVSWRLRNVCQDAVAWDRFYVPVVKAVLPSARYCVVPYDRTAAVQPWFWCDYCARFFTETSETGKHVFCLECQSLFCSRLTDSSLCIRCSHDVNETACHGTWPNCRKKVRIIGGIFSCFLEKCQICFRYTKDTTTLLLRDRTSMSVVWKSVCHECQSGYTKCLCLHTDCSCSRRDVHTTKSTIICEYCKNYHCRLLSIPRCIRDINLAVWKKYAYNHTSWRVVVKQLLALVSKTDRPVDRLSIMTVLYGIQYMRKVLIFGDCSVRDRPINPAFRLQVERTLDKNIAEVLIKDDLGEQAAEQLISLKRKLVKYFESFSDNDDIKAHEFEILPLQ